MQSISIHGRSITVLLTLLLFLPCLCIFACKEVPIEEDNPEEEEVINVPHYYFENNYLDNRVAVINEAIKACSDNYEAFFWITDIHWEEQFNTRQAPVLIKYLASKTSLDMILNGGDTADSKEVCEDAIAHLREAIGSNKVYTVTGNHEIVNASSYENPFARVADAIRNHNSDVLFGDNDRSYFYFNNTDNKVRYVGLASFGYYHDKKCDSCYTPEQLEWFTNTALNVEPGWTIIIFTHSIYAVSCATDKMYTSPVGANDFIAAIYNYHGNGTIACVLIGHTHRDRIHIGNTGVPYIISASDRYYPYLDDINVLRVPGTISEQHFEVFVMDKGKREIKLFSIGANARDGYDNEPGEEVDVRVVNY